MMKTVVVLSCLMAVSLAFPFFKKDISEIFPKHSVMEREISESRKKQVRETFDTLDTDNDGSLTITEYAGYASKLDDGQTSFEEYQEIFRQYMLPYDKNQNGSIEFQELLDLVAND